MTSAMWTIPVLPLAMVGAEVGARSGATAADYVAVGCVLAAVAGVVLAWRWIEDGWTQRLREAFDHHNELDAERHKGLEEKIDALRDLFDEGRK